MKAVEADLETSRILREKQLKEMKSQNLREGGGRRGELKLHSGLKKYEIDTFIS